ncbi:MAG: sugar ABC transporter permease [Anaerolineae bacterium]|nr:sugar ABC transporter permease [Anaerolineae bacterium]
MSDLALSKKSAVPRQKNPQDLLRRREGLIGLLFLSPWILGFVLLKLAPIVASLVFSFTDFYMLTPEEISFVGLENYLRVLGDIDAGSSLSGSLGYFLFTVPIQLFAALALAAVFSSNRVRAKSFLRPLFFMPSIIPAGAILFIYLGFVDPGSGWLNRLIMEPLGLPPVPGPFTGMSFSILLGLMALWSIGPGFLIMYGAMQAIPSEIIEAARVDGAGPLARFFYISIPMISPAIFFALVINLTSAFGGTVLLDRGYLFSVSLSPMESYINSMMFGKFELGYAAALAWVMFAVTMLITLALFRSANRWVYFPDEVNREEF